MTESAAADNCMRGLDEYRCKGGGLRYRHIYVSAIVKLAERNSVFSSNRRFIESFIYSAALALSISLPNSVYCQGIQASGLDSSTQLQRTKQSEKEVYLNSYIGVGITAGNAFEEGLEKSLKNGLNLTAGFQITFYPRHSSDDRLSLGVEGGTSFDLMKRTVWRCESFSDLGNEFQQGRFFQQKIFYLIPYIQLGNPKSGLFTQAGIGIHTSWWKTNMIDLSGWKKHYWQSGQSYAITVGYSRLLLKFQSHNTSAEYELLDSDPSNDIDTGGLRLPWTADTKMLTLSIRF